MDSKKRKEKKSYSKKEKKLIKLINKSDSENEDSEHELSYYLNDRVKLMKEVLKIIKPKKIKCMAPDCMSDLDNEEINSMLLEELLGISNKRLKYIFNGQNLEEDSSSTDPEQEIVDIISLDDISEDDLIVDLDSDNNAKLEKNKKHKVKVKEEHKRKRIKKEKPDKSSKNKSSKKSKDSDLQKTDEQNLMSVLELLELQARARAIRSQLTLEHKRKKQEKEKHMVKLEESDNDDAILIESPENIEIVITSSDSEDEGSTKAKRSTDSMPKQSKEVHNRNECSSSVENANESIEDNSIKKTDGNHISAEHSGSTKQLSCEETAANTDQDKTECADENEKNDSEKSQSEYIRNKSQNSSILQEGVASTSKEVNGSKNSKKREKCIKRKIRKATKINKPTDESSFQIDADKSKAIGEKWHEKNDDETDCVKIKIFEVDLLSNQDKAAKLEKFKDNDMHIQDKVNTTDDGDGIVINVDQSEIDCIISDQYV